jgi:hypothetical protein
MFCVFDVLYTYILVLKILLKNKQINLAHEYKKYIYSTYIGENFIDNSYQKYFDLASILLSEDDAYLLEDIDETVNMIVRDFDIDLDKLSN